MAKPLNPIQQHYLDLALRVIGNYHGDIPMGEYNGLIRLMKIAFEDNSLPEWPCPHIGLIDSGMYKGQFTTPALGHTYVPFNWQMCPVCGAIKPNKL